MEDLNVLERYWICSLGHINDTSGLSKPTSGIKRCIHCGSTCNSKLRRVGQPTNTAQPSYPFWYAYLETNVVTH